MKDLHDFAYWTCLQLERWANGRKLNPLFDHTLTTSSDILAELDLPASGISRSEGRIDLPKGHFTLRLPQNPKNSTMMFFYSAQIHLRKVLNQIHTDLYKVGSGSKHTTSNLVLLGLFFSNMRWLQKMERAVTLSNWAFRAACLRFLEWTLSSGGRAYPIIWTGMKMTRLHLISMLPDCVPNITGHGTLSIDHCCITLYITPWARTFLNLSVNVVLNRNKVHFRPRHRKPPVWHGGLAIRAYLEIAVMIFTTPLSGKSSLGWYSTRVKHVSMPPFEALRHSMVSKDGQ